MELFNRILRVLAPLAGISGPPHRTITLGGFNLLSTLDIDSGDLQPLELKAAILSNFKRKAYFSEQTSQGLETIAAQIASDKVDLVALHGAVGTISFASGWTNDTVVADQAQVIVDSLADIHGLEYTVVVERSGMHFVEDKGDGDLVLSISVTDTILVRTGALENGLTVSNPQASVFTELSSFIDEVGKVQTTPHQWLSVDATLDGSDAEGFRFVSTQLDSSCPFVRVEQARELLDSPGSPLRTANGPIALVGDLASEIGIQPFRNLVDAADLLVASGFQLGSIEGARVNQYARGSSPCDLVESSQNTAIMYRQAEDRRQLEMLGFFELCQKPEYGNIPLRRYGSIVTLGVAVQDLQEEAIVFSETEEDLPDRLHFKPLVPYVPCGDGSPAGIYVSTRGKKGALSENNHVLVFQGGGACSSRKDCIDELAQEPYKLSSTHFPSDVSQDTILSNDETKNPTFHNFTKWLVPYCSQDLYLGSGRRPNGDCRLNNAGSKHFVGALAHWAKSVGNVRVDTLVVVGISAGAVGVLNHFDKLRTLAHSAGVASLRIILDSSLLSEDDEVKPDEVVNGNVDVDQHPYCYRRDLMSDIPCCLSTGCMIRHHEAIASWVWNSTSTGVVGDDKLLLIDSAFDPFVLSKSTHLPARDMGISSALAYFWDVGEAGGARKRQVVEALFKDVSVPSSRLVWAVTSAVSHTFLIPSLDLESLRCLQGDPPQEDAHVVCRPSFGLGLRKKFALDLRITLWLSTETWELATANGTSVKDLITGFVQPQQPPVARDMAIRAGLIEDTCNGPVCVNDGANSSNPAQQLIEIDDTFVEVPVWLQVVNLCFLAILVTSYVLRLPMPKVLSSRKGDHDDISVTDRVDVSVSAGVGESSVSRRGPKKSSRRPIIVKDLTVISESDSQRNLGKTPSQRALGTFGIRKRSSRGLGKSQMGTLTAPRAILDAVTFEQEAGLVTGLFGKSGSGKTTLLTVLSQQHSRSLLVANSEATNINGRDCTYVRQHDLIQMEKLTAAEFLPITAKLYGASREALVFSMDAVRAVFENEQENDGNRLNPFSEAKIGSLSGGQRRTLAIATALLTNTHVLLLDEPLSGLDSIASLRLMNLLRRVSGEKNCSIFMSTHQPSDEVLDLMDAVIVLANGKLVYQQSVKNMKEAYGSLSRQIHELLASDGSARAESLLGKRAYRKLRQTMIRSIKSSMRSSASSMRTSLKIESVQEPRRLWQIRPLIMRLHLEHGSNWTDIVTLPVCFTILALWMRFDNGSAMQVYLVTVFTVGIPLNIFRHKIVLSSKILRAHQWELQDRRISHLAYLLGKSLFLLATPVLSVLLSNVVVYLALGWHFKTFVVQYLFTAVYMLVGLQFGFMLVAYANGNYYSVAKLYSLYIFLSFLFAGVLVDPNKIPEGLRWLIYTSFSFWGISGAVLNQFQFNDNIGENPCLSFGTCMAFDPNLIARYLGFTPISTSFLAMVILTLWLLALVAVEYVFLLRLKERKS